MAKTNFNLKQDAITFGKSILSKIPFNSIYSYADTLFDKKSLPNGSEELAQEIKFLTTTALKDVAYDNIDDSEFFSLKNVTNNQSIRVANRISSKGEIRGNVLRNYLDSEKYSRSDETLYQVITSIIRIPKYSDVVAALQPLFVGKTAQEQYGESMHPKHFELFATIERAMKQSRPAIGRFQY